MTKTLPISEAPTQKKLQAFVKVWANCYAVNLCRSRKSSVSR